MRMFQCSKEPVPITSRVCKGQGGTEDSHQNKNGFYPEIRPAILWFFPYGFALWQALWVVGSTSGLPQASSNISTYDSVCLWDKPRDYQLFLLRLVTKSKSRSQWPRGLRRRCAASRLLRSWVRIPPGAWMSVCCECYVLSLRQADPSYRGDPPSVCAVSLSATKILYTYNE